MNSNPHERARMLIASSGPEGVFNPEQSWLAAHLESCVSCREFAENAGETVRAMRTIPIMAAGTLVSATKARVRQRAQELHRHRERQRVIWVCCAAVTLCTAVNTAVLWRGFVWLGQYARLSTPVWETGFVVLCLMPAIVAGILMLARGTHLADHNGSFQG